MLRLPSTSNIAMAGAAAAGPAGGERYISSPGGCRSAHLAACRSSVVRLPKYLRQNSQRNRRSRPL